MKAPSSAMPEPPFDAFGSAFLLHNARIPVCLAPGVSLAADQDGLAACDILVDSGRIATIGPVGGIPSVDMLMTDHFAIDWRGGMVLPCFVESHTHLDKGHIWPRRRNPDGTFMGALMHVGEDRDAHWSASDVRARMDFSLRCAFVHGTAAIRTHLDSIGKQVDISWSVFDELRAEWRGRIALQATALFGIEYAEDKAALDHVAKTVRRVGGQLGPVPYPLPNLAELLERCFRAAMDHGLDLDFHVDETQDPTSQGLEAIADTALRLRFPGRILVGHCCSLARQPVEMQKRVIGKLAEARIAVVSLPLCNLYLQDRQVPPATPLYRGVTLLHELKAAGVVVMISSDNTRDPFYAYGDLDGLEVFREAVRIAHLDHPFGDWISAITATPAETIGVAAGRLAIGAPADLMLFGARSYAELLSRPQSDRIVLRDGRPIDRTLPDYRELDAIVGNRAA
jgi:cytosine/creatinine deaminase